MTSIRDGRAGLRLDVLLRVGAAAGLLAAGGCAPTLEWREVRADGRALVASFPCRPQRRERSVALVGATVTTSMLSCAAEGNTYAIAFADVADPAAVTAVLDAWRKAAASNLGSGVASIDDVAPVPALVPLPVPGMTPNVSAGRVHIEGRLPDGAAVVEQAVFFVHGLRIFQASVISPAPVDASLTPFFSALRLVP